MDSNAIQILQAQMAAYAALVNTLKEANAIDATALLGRLGRYAEMMQKERPLGAQILAAQATMISGQPPDMAAIAQILH